jgi:uncharacterized membrane protein
VNWAVKYVFAPFIVIDKHVGVKEALHHSAQLTEGIKLKLIGIYVVYCIIMMLSIIPLGLGLFVTVPMGVVLPFLIYDRLDQRSGHGAPAV